MGARSPTRQYSESDLKRGRGGAVWPCQAPARGVIPESHPLRTLAVRGVGVGVCESPLASLCGRRAPGVRGIGNAVKSEEVCGVVHTSRLHLHRPVGPLSQYHGCSISHKYCGL